MTNKELILSKQSKIIVVTRDKNLYWFGKFNNEDIMYCLSAGINRKLCEYWDDDLLAKRNGVWDIYNLPRDKDIIFIFEITDDITFFKIIRKIEFMKYRDLEHYTNDKYVKLIFERIDGVFEER